jgi:hypothetical protein
VLDHFVEREIAHPPIFPGHPRVGAVKNCLDDADVAPFSLADPFSAEKRNSVAIRRSIREAAQESCGACRRVTNKKNGHAVMVTITDRGLYGQRPLH